MIDLDDLALLLEASFPRKAGKLVEMRVAVAKQGLRDDRFELVPSLI